MEWKEHVAWLSPILATVVAFIVLYYGVGLIRHDGLRKTTLLLFVLAFAFAAIAGLFGALNLLPGVRARRIATSPVAGSPDRLGVSREGSPRTARRPHASVANTR